MNNSAKAIIFTNVGKRYYLHRRQQNFILHDAIRRVLGSRKHLEEFWALKDVSFEIPFGQSVAFIGSNGAGKSTLLGLVAGTVYPTVGDARVCGRVGALLELGAGFHYDLTGRENVFLNASLLGMHRSEVEELYEQIVDFSELRDFMDIPLRNYSSGMQVRLGFSVAIHTDPEILIMDEVLAVGDQHFQQKCIKRVQEFRDKKRTLLFVSHGIDAITTLCERVIWLDHGQVRMDDLTPKVLPEYQKAMS